MYYPAKLFHETEEGKGPSMGFPVPSYRGSRRIVATFYFEKAVQLFNDNQLKSHDLEMKRAQLKGKEVPGSVIMVDECQDCDECQIDWVVQQASKHKKQLFCVGDAAHTIYSFRGAKSEYLVQLEDKPPSNCEFVSKQLTCSWRFGPQIAF